MKLTKEQVLKKLQERRAQQEKQTPPAKRPVYSERKHEDLTQRRVVREDVRKPITQGPRTISEDIKLRTKDMNKEQQHLYKTLAENMTQAVRVLTEATQSGPGTYGITGQGAGVGLMKTYFDIFFGYFSKPNRYGNCFNTANQN
jgi:hypothetical protein